MSWPQIARALRSAREFIDWHRRAFAALLAGIAVLAGLSSLSPHPPPSRQIWIAARDLTGGAPLTSRDVTAVAFPLADVPAGALAGSASVVGRLLAAPVRRGEPLTDVRLLAPSLLAALNRPGLVAVPVRVADGPAAAALVRSGDIVDVLGTSVADDGSQLGTTRVVVASVTVLAVPPTGDDAGLVVVAATPGQANALADATSTDRLSVVLRR
jgi:Flp pilus assembly protein CpaB